MWTELSVKLVLNAGSQINARVFIEMSEHQPYSYVTDDNSFFLANEVDINAEN